MGRYVVAMKGSSPELGGRRTELMSGGPSRPVGRPPPGGPLCVRFERGVLAHGTANGSPSTRVSWQSWPACRKNGSRSRGTARSRNAVTEHGTPLPRPAPERRGPEPSPGAAYRRTDAGEMSDGIDD